MMKVNQSVAIFCFLLGSLSLSCSSASTKSRRPVSRIETSANQITLGSDLKVDVQVKVHGGSLRKVELYLNDSLLHSASEEEFSHKIPTLNELGRHQLKVVALKADGQEGVNFKNIDVLSANPPAELSLRVLNSFPHNPTFFTEGFEVHDGKFYESTGEYGTSGIYQFDLKSGNIIRKLPLEEKYFGEGMTILNGKVYQLTYKAKTGLVYDYQSFKQVDSFSYPNKEGWGMTNNGEQLIKSDGSEYIDFFSPDTYEITHRIAVCDNRGAIKNINELEYHNGVIYANVWMTDTILKIDAQTGEVLARVDCSALRRLVGNPTQIDVLNGIAIDKANGKMYLTGKYWDKVFEVELLGS
ncbi:MAG: glutaminyl-peptide cyclotransferase [Mangrovibacterium sp.]